MALGWPGVELVGISTTVDPPNKMELSDHAKELQPLAIAAGLLD
jgi:hypothetical protein